MLQIHLAVFYPFEQIAEWNLQQQKTGGLKWLDITVEKKNNIGSYTC